MTHPMTYDSPTVPGGILRPPHARRGRDTGDCPGQRVWTHNDHQAPTSPPGIVNVQFGSSRGGGRREEQGKT